MDGYLLNMTENQFIILKMDKEKESSIYIDLLLWIVSL